MLVFESSTVLLIKFIVLPVATPTLTYAYIWNDIFVGVNAVLAERNCDLSTFFENAKEAIGRAVVDQGDSVMEGAPLIAQILRRFIADAFVNGVPKAFPCKNAEVIARLNLAELSSVKSVVFYHRERYFFPVSVKNTAADLYLDMSCS